jgi:hypothetical protein
MSFGTPADVATRLGRDLNATETATAQYLLDAATSLIARAAGKDDDWAAALSPVSPLLVFVSVEMVARVMSNPNSLKEYSERLGDYRLDATFDPSTLGLELMNREQEIVGQAVGMVATSASVELSSHATLDFPQKPVIDLNDPAYWIGGGPDYHWQPDE